MVHRTTDLFFVLKFKHRVICGRFTRESYDTSHATPATSTREPTHPRVSACSKNIKIVSYHRVRGRRAYGLLPLWLLFWYILRCENLFYSSISYDCSKFCEEYLHFFTFMTVTFARRVGLRNILCFSPLNHWKSGEGVV